MSGYNYESYGQPDVGAPDFWSVAVVGGHAPQFSLLRSRRQPGFVGVICR